MAQVIIQPLHRLRGLRVLQTRSEHTWANRVSASPPSKPNAVGKYLLSPVYFFFGLNHVYS